MKLCKIIFLATTSMLFSVQTLSAQQPYLPKFKQADPVWQHVLVNPLFQKHPEASFLENSYTCVSTQLTTQLVVDSFLISVVPTSSGLIFNDGLIVQKINIKTGEVLWRDILYDPKIDSIGYVSISYDIYMRKDGKIEFCGSRKVVDDNIQLFDQSYRAVAGPIGIMAGAVARHVGARHVVITDVNPARLALAAEVADVTPVNVAQEDLRDVMARVKIVQGFDVGMEMSGNQHGA